MREQRMTRRVEDPWFSKGEVLVLYGVKDQLAVFECVVLGMVDLFTILV